MPRDIRALARATAPVCSKVGIPSGSLPRLTCAVALRRCAGAGGRWGAMGSTGRHRQDGAIGDGAAAVELRAAGGEDISTLGSTSPTIPTRPGRCSRRQGTMSKPPAVRLMAHGAEAALPTIATIMKTQWPSSLWGNRGGPGPPRISAAFDAESGLGPGLIFTSAAIDPYSISRALDTRAGNNTPNHQDTHVDALIDRMREAATEEEFGKAGHAFQRYMAEHMMSTASPRSPSCKRHAARSKAMSICMAIRSVRDDVAE